ELPHVVTTVESALAQPGELAEQVADLARGARDCLPLVEGRLASMLTWRVREGDKAVELTGWLPDPTAAAGEAAVACVRSRFDKGRIALPEAADNDAMGLVRFGVQLPASAPQPRPPPPPTPPPHLPLTPHLDG